MDVTSCAFYKEEEKPGRTSHDGYARIMQDQYIYASHLSIMRDYSRSKTWTDVECSSSLKHRWQSDCGSKAHICGFEGKRALA